jgi:hypothetical protein
VSWEFGIIQQEPILEQGAYQGIDPENRWISQVPRFWGPGAHSKVLEIVIGPCHPLGK